MVASDLPGYRNVSVNGDEAFLVPPGEAGMLAKALTKVLTDQALTQGLIEAGTKRVAEFSMERLAGVYVEIYERAIAIEKADPERGGWRGELSRMGWPFR